MSIVKKVEITKIPLYILHDIFTFDTDIKKHGIIAIKPKWQTSRYLLVYGLHETDENKKVNGFTIHFFIAYLLSSRSNQIEPISSASDKVALSVCLRSLSVGDSDLSVLIT